MVTFINKGRKYVFAPILANSLFIIKDIGIKGPSSTDRDNLENAESEDLIGCSARWSMKYAYPAIRLLKGNDFVWVLLPLSLFSPIFSSNLHMKGERKWLVFKSKRPLGLIIKSSFFGLRSLDLGLIFTNSLLGQANEIFSSGPAKPDKYLWLAEVSRRWETYKLDENLGIRWNCRNWTQITVV